MRYSFEPQKAAYQGTHHNKTRPPLNILFLFTEKDAVDASTISRLKCAKREQCFRVFPVGLGSETTETVRELLRVNGGRGVVMTNDRVSFDHTLKGPATILDHRVVSSLKGTRDVLLTMASDMREPYVCYSILFSLSLICVPMQPYQNTDTCAEQENPFGSVKQRCLR